MKKMISTFIVGFLIIGGFATVPIFGKNQSLKEFDIFDKYDMVIIAPDQFSSTLQPLIDHKNNYNIRTFLKTTEEIYDEYGGRDNAEQIKYFIKDAAETFEISYVFIIGDINLVPMRKTAVTVLTTAIIWTEILTDLYYADINNADGSFSSWDTNNNNVFGECNYGYYNLESTIPPDPKIIDHVDLHPDIGMGRLPCSTNYDVQNITNNIIFYESETCGCDWFNNIILMGGDTEPLEGNGLLEGEQVELTIEQEMIKHGFKNVKLFTSLGTFNLESILNEINNGAGFVSYSGHGNTEYIATYPKNESNFISCRIIDIKDLRNANKRPIFFLDACQTGKFDNNRFDGGLLSVFPFCIVKLLLEKTFDLETFPCFAWSLIKSQSGGGIATIASSSPTWFGYEYNSDQLEILYGSNIFHQLFFEAYKPGIILSDMFQQAQNSYIEKMQSPNSMLWDRNTVDGFNLIGDPSLKIGGYE